MPPMSTVGHPGGTIAVGGWGATPGNMQAWGVPTVAAGRPPMRTVSTPGRPDDTGMCGRIADSALLEA